MPATDTRPRKSTLSKISKIFGVPDKATSNHPYHDESTTIKSNSQINTSSGKSTSPASSQISSINSSTSSLNELHIQTSNPQKSSRPPSRTSSVNNKKQSSQNNTNLNVNTIEELQNLKIKNSVEVSRSSSLHSHQNNAHSALNAKYGSISRFIVLEDGTHEHHLKNAKRQEKLSNMLKNLLGAQKLRDEAVSAVPEILSNNPPTLFAGLVNQYQENTPISGATRIQGLPSTTNISATYNQTFAERYGRCQEVVGKGTFGVVRISHKRNGDKEKLFAVKEFKRKPNESDSKYSRRLTSEFCISSSLKHTNIIETLDLLQDAKGDYVEVMEYCQGGDLYTLIIAAGKLEYLEADCFFKQLIRGVVYMHDMGVAHRDLKPENLLLTENGTLKITDFGNGECFKMAWEDNIHLSGGICGSSPYIAPEEYNTKEFDPRMVDIWACGVIYMAMRTGRHLWRTATQDDEFFLKYLEGRKSSNGYEPIEHLKRARCRNVIYSILDPIPNRRINGKQILNSEWGREIKCCV